MANTCLNVRDKVPVKNFKTLLSLTTALIHLNFPTFSKTLLSLNWRLLMNKPEMSSAASSNVLTLPSIEKDVLLAHAAVSLAMTMTNVISVNLTKFSRSENTNIMVKSSLSLNVLTLVLTINILTTPLTLATNALLNVMMAAQIQTLVPVAIMDLNKPKSTETNVLKLALPVHTNT
jgi:hypothetical protein